MEAGLAGPAGHLVPKVKDQGVVYVTIPRRGQEVCIALENLWKNNSVKTQIWTTFGETYAQKYLCENAYTHETVYYALL